MMHMRHYSVGLLLFLLNTVGTELCHAAEGYHGRPALPSVYGQQVYGQPPYYVVPQQPHMMFDPGTGRWFQVQPQAPVHLLPPKPHTVVLYEHGIIECPWLWLARPPYFSNDMLSVVLESAGSLITVQFDKRYYCVGQIDLKKIQEIGIESNPIRVRLFIHALDFYSDFERGFFKKGPVAVMGDLARSQPFVIFRTEDGVFHYMLFSEYQRFSRTQEAYQLRGKAYLAGPYIYQNGQIVPATELPQALPSLSSPLVTSLSSSVSAVSDASITTGAGVQQPMEDKERNSFEGHVTDLREQLRVPQAITTVVDSVVVEPTTMVVTSAVSASQDITGQSVAPAQVSSVAAVPVDQQEQEPVKLPTTKVSLKVGQKAPSGNASKSTPAPVKNVASTAPVQAKPTVQISSLDSRQFPTLSSSQSLAASKSVVVTLPLKQPAQDAQKPVIQKVAPVTPVVPVVKQEQVESADIQKYEGVLLEKAPIRSAKEKQEADRKARKKQQDKEKLEKEKQKKLVEQKEKEAEQERRVQEKAAREIMAQKEAAQGTVSVYKPTVSDVVVSAVPAVETVQSGLTVDQMHQQLTNFWEKNDYAAFIDFVSKKSVKKAGIVLPPCTAIVFLLQGCVDRANSKSYWHKALEYAVSGSKEQKIAQLLMHLRECKKSDNACMCIVNVRNAQETLDQFEGWQSIALNIFARYELSKIHTKLIGMDYLKDAINKCENFPEHFKESMKSLIALVDKKNKELEEQFVKKEKTFFAYGNVGETTEFTLEEKLWALKFAAWIGDSRVPSALKAYMKTNKFTVVENQLMGIMRAHQMCAQYKAAMAENSYQCDMKSMQKALSNMFTEMTEKYFVDASGAISIAAADVAYEYANACMNVCHTLHHSVLSDFCNCQKNALDALKGHVGSQECMAMARVLSKKYVSQDELQRDIRATLLRNDFIGSSVSAIAQIIEIEEYYNAYDVAEATRKDIVTNFFIDRILRGPFSEQALVFLARLLTPGYGSRCVQKDVSQKNRDSIKNAWPEFLQNFAIHLSKMPLEDAIRMANLVAIFNKIAALLQCEPYWMTTDFFNHSNIQYAAFKTDEMSLQKCQEFIERVNSAIEFVRQNKNHEYADELLCIHEQAKLYSFDPKCLCAYSTLLRECGVMPDQIIDFLAPGALLESTIHSQLINLYLQTGTLSLLVNSRMELSEHQHMINECAEKIRMYYEHLKGFSYREVVQYRNSIEKLIASIKMQQGTVPQALIACVDDPVFVTQDTSMFMRENTAYYLLQKYTNACYDGSETANDFIHGAVAMFEQGSVDEEDVEKVRHFLPFLLKVFRQASIIAKERDFSKLLPATTAISKLITYAYVQDAEKGYRLILQAIVSEFLVGKSIESLVSDKAQDLINISEKCSACAIPLIIKCLAELSFQQLLADDTHGGITIQTIRQMFRNASYEDIGILLIVDKYLNCLSEMYDSRKTFESLVTSPEGDIFDLGRSYFNVLAQGSANPYHTMAVTIHRIRDAVARVTEQHKVTLSKTFIELSTVLQDSLSLPGLDNRILDQVTRKAMEDFQRQRCFSYSLQTIAEDLFDPAKINEKDIDEYVYLIGLSVREEDKPFTLQECRSILENILKQKVPSNFISLINKTMVSDPYRDSFYEHMEKIAQDTSSPNNLLTRIAKLLLGDLQIDHKLLDRNALQVAGKALLDKTTHQQTQDDQFKTMLERLISSPTYTPEALRVLMEKVIDGCSQDFQVRKDQEKKYFDMAMNVVTSILGKDKTRQKKFMDSLKNLSDEENALIDLVISLQNTILSCEDNEKAIAICNGISISQKGFSQRSIDYGFRHINRWKANILEKKAAEDNVRITKVEETTIACINTLRSFQEEDQRKEFSELIKRHLVRCAGNETFIQAVILSIYKGIAQALPNQEDPLRLMLQEQLIMENATEIQRIWKIINEQNQKS